MSFPSLKLPGAPETAGAANTLFQLFNFNDFRRVNAFNHELCDAVPLLNLEVALCMVEE